ncbi:hypothetical protein SUGI_0427170 [Cryptomeria japonica]|nr:hypothetical protein SUGI_0427170 [Cryptomeria japonica]
MKVLPKKKSDLHAASNLTNNHDSKDCIADMFDVSTDKEIEGEGVVCLKEELLSALDVIKSLRKENQDLKKKNRREVGS